MGIALEINQDVDFVAMDVFRGLAVRAGVNVDKAVKRGLQPRAHRTAIIRTVGISENLEAVAVVAFKQLDHQSRCGVLVEISRQVANTNAGCLNRNRMAKYRLRRWRHGPDPV